MNNTNIGYVICETAATTKEATILDKVGNRVVIEAVLQDMDVKNRNGRIYPSKEIIPELTCDRLKELISTGNMCGEAGHPMSKDLSRQQTIDPNNVSHKIIKLWHDGKNIMAHLKGTPNRVGEDFNNFILDGTLPSFSLRALGTVQNTAKGAEVRNIRIITWDWVIYPSHKAAYMQKVASLKESALLTESSNLILNESDSGLLVPITNDKVINAIKNESANINTILESYNTLYDNMVLIENGRKVQLNDKQGHMFIINLEEHVQNSIMKYCNRF